MTNSVPRTLAVLALGGLMFFAPGLAQADQGDCGQPSSTGATPKTSDAQTILRKAVGIVGTDCDAEMCICDVNSDGNIRTSDAQATLRNAVGQEVPLECDCPPVDGLPCTSARLTTLAGSDLDSGWTGLAHDSEVVVGAEINARVKRECSGGEDIECKQDDDCPGEETCEATCDCLGDTSCEVTGPTHGRNCLNNLAPCDATVCFVAGNATETACETDADCESGTCSGATNCDAGVECVHTFGPPLPLASGGTPVCVITYFAGPLTGTADSSTGQGVAAADLRSRIYLGNAGLEKPCPVCGAPDQNPEAGDVFTCDGGQFNGAACTVEGVTEDFGGTSSSCPPTPGQFNSSLAIRFQEITTSTTTKTAGLPCKFFGFTGNPLVPNSNPKCLDKNGPSDPVCSSNADCTRCTEDPSITCASNADCTGNGTCAEAPDQPVTCGFWCNCGLCGNDPLLPCFDTSDCPGELTCDQGLGSGTQATAPQSKNNNCSSDKFICGAGQEERCDNTFQGTCSDASYRTCEFDSDCEVFDAGSCVINTRACFEPRITRTGVPSPLGSYCAFEDKACTSNGDCTGTDDFCVEDSSRPVTAALFCVPTSASSAVNSAGGIMGPGAVQLNSLLEVCRCGDGDIGCDEECDDENLVNGDGCDDLCEIE